MVTIGTGTTTREGEMTFLNDERKECTYVVMMTNRIKRRTRV